MVDDMKTALNRFWRDCADDGLQIEVSEAEKVYIDGTFWCYIEHPTIKKGPPVGDPWGYEPLTRVITRTILYKIKMVSIYTYVYTVVSEEVTTFVPVVFPI